MAFTLLDGGMGQELMARSKAEPTGLWATQTMMDTPEMVQAVHKDYFDAGADIATTNSYAILRDRLALFDIEDQFETLQVRACEIACRARDQKGSGLVAGSMGPTGRSYRPDLALEIEQGAEIYAEIAGIQAPYVDFYLLETMSSIVQATGAVLGTKSVGKPVWLSVTVDDADGSKLRSGESISELTALLSESQVDALLINCSTPEAVTSALQKLGPQTIPIGAYANGFTKIAEEFLQDNATVTALNARTDLDPEAYLNFAKQWHELGASIIGGCCEVGPAHIMHLAKHFKEPLIKPE